jgi:hypothetical protein
LFTPDNTLISLLSTAVQGELVAFGASGAVLGTVSPLFSPGFVAKAAKRKYPLGLS